MLADRGERTPEKQPPGLPSDGARVKILVMVRRILNKHGYRPDLRAEAVKLMLEQAEALCAEWVA